MSLPVLRCLGSDGLKPDKCRYCLESEGRRSHIFSVPGRWENKMRGFLEQVNIPRDNLDAKFSYVIDFMRDSDRAHEYIDLFMRQFLTRRFPKHNFKSHS